MFNKGFKFSVDGANRVHSSEDEKRQTRVHSTASQDEKHQARFSSAASQSSGDEKSDVDVKEGPSTLMRNNSDTRSANERPAEECNSPRRTFAAVMSDWFRRSSETSNKDGSDPPSRKHSHNNVSSARGVANTLGLFQSHNPDTDSEAAAAVNSAFPRKHSVQSNHSGEDMPLPSPEMGRRPSYMPRNATASFLKTATGTSEEKPAAAVAEEKAAAVGRKTSIMGTTMGLDGNAGVTAGRRPSGMMPNTVASRYVRSASQGNDEQDPSSRRRSSAKSRQTSNANANTTDTQIKPISMQPDQFIHWQQSVQRNGSTSSASPHRVSFAPALNRQPSFNETVQEVPEDEEEEDEVDNTGLVRQKKPLNGNSKMISISVQGATPPQMKQSKPMSNFLADQISPMTNSFGAEVDQELEQIKEAGSRPETPLESLGFKGAVPA